MGYGMSWQVPDHAIYANGVTMDISGDFPNGIKFYGSDGWIFVTRR